MHQKLLATVLLTCALLPAQTAPAAPPDEDYTIYTEHPRLLLNSKRLRLLKRERERKSPRWQQLETLIVGRAQMAEPGFANALVYQISGDEAAGRQAVNWALSAGADLRQLALVLDWCQPLLSEAQSRALEARLRQALQQTARATDAVTVRSRVFAAIALGDGATVQQIVRGWWRSQTAPALRSGKLTPTRPEAYALLELMHAVRDAVQVDLRENAPAYFHDLPAYQLLSYYPAAYPAAENDYHIPFFTGTGQPDLPIAALSRALELSFVAYESNARESQFLQGWLLHDRYTMKSTFGAPYEFLWANPYQPGLSYFHMPLRLHNKRTGQLFLRSSWDEDAAWLGYAQGQMQLFDKGKLQLISAKGSPQPIVLGDSGVLQGKSQLKWTLFPDAPEAYFVVGLKPSHAYDVEIDDEELTEEWSDVGGILFLTSLRKDGAGVRLRETEIARVPPSKD
ncbi:MAG TPA: hypothetical protein VMZ52_12920 [Bryobacteraceae bacterium]|nr:hypothetical protein [Bryobacteraceae bacterium]